jgi:hypothetical protein
VLLGAQQGFLDSIFKLANVPLVCLYYTRISRRTKQIAVVGTGVEKLISIGEFVAVGKDGGDVVFSTNLNRENRHLDY